MKSSRNNRLAKHFSIDWGVEIRWKGTLETLVSNIFGAVLIHIDISSASEDSAHKFHQLQWKQEITTTNRSLTPDFASFRLLDFYFPSKMFGLCHLSVYLEASFNQKKNIHYRSSFISRGNEKLSEKLLKRPFKIQGERSLLL